MLEKPDIAIMDLDMPSLNGIDATRQIAKIAMRTKVLLLAPHDAEFLLLQALEAGVSGYLLQSAKADDLIFAVESLHNGRPFFTARLARHASEEPLKILNSANDGKRFKTSRQLTPREREVIQLVAEGRSNKEVGFTLHISVKTAETHRANIMHKIDSHSIVELVRYAIRNQIIQA
jgi:DNA-binding NarL/FixJ family response regulator